MQKLLLIPFLFLAIINCQFLRTMDLNQDSFSISDLNEKYICDGFKSQGVIEFKSLFPISYDNSFYKFGGLVQKDVIITAEIVAVKGKGVTKINHQTFDLKAGDHLLLNFESGVPEIKYDEKDLVYDAELKLVQELTDTREGSVRKQTVECFKFQISRT